LCTWQLSVLVSMVLAAGYISMYMGANEWVGFETDGNGTWLG